MAASIRQPQAFGRVVTQLLPDPGSFFVGLRFAQTPVLRGLWR